MKFYERGKRGTMRGPQKFNAMASSIKLFRAMRGLGTDKAAITEVLAFHTAEQRRELKNKYKYVYKKELAQVLEDELSMNYGRLVAALMMEPEDYILQCIQRTITPQKSGAKKLVRRLSQLFTNGLGKDEYVLIDLLCFKSNKYLEALKAAYKEKYDEDLVEKIAEEGNMLPQDFCNLIQDMLSCDREEDEQVDMEKVNEDLDDILDEDIKELAVQTLFQERSYPHIRKVFVEYRKKTGELLDKMIEDSVKFSDVVKGAYLAIFSKIRNEHLYYAERLRMAIDGVGRDDDALIRIVVLRSEVDLLDIMDAYKDKYGIDLGTNVHNETSGEYREMLTKIIRVPGENEGEMVIGPEDVKMNKEEMEDLELDENKMKKLMEEASGDEEDEEGGKSKEDDDD